MKINCFALIFSMFLLMLGACSDDAGQLSNAGPKQAEEDCESHEKLCGDTCTDTRLDAVNCGDCGMVCDAGEVCQAGQCTKGASCDGNGLSICGGSCVDTSSNTAHCGGCETPCPSTGPNVEAATCSAGVCGVECKANWGSCDGNPETGCETDLGTDANHCGGCGIVCSDDQICSDGVCECPTGQVECNGSCVNPEDSPCGCPAGQVDCDGSCVDLQDSVDNCGQCGNTCDAGEECHQSACVVCQPGRYSCDGDTLQVCNGGTHWEEDAYCDPLMGLSCNEQFGQCDGECSPQALGSYSMSYVGCEYYPTITGNTVSEQFDFAVAVSNTSDEPAIITVSGGMLEHPLTFTVAPASLEVRPLPWVLSLKGANSVHQKNRAYRLRSTKPVTVYQFNALQYRKGSAYSYSNDASMLMPVNVMSGQYYVAAWQYWPQLYNPGLMAITAIENNTDVTVNARAPISGSPTVTGFDANQPTTITLQAGDVLQLVNKTGDLTGSFVSSTQPIQVIGGHYCTNIPLDVTACDHLEESIFPLETLSDHYIVTSPAVPSIPNGKIQNVRIIATKANTTITYDPPQSGAPTMIANAGDFIELRSDASYVVSSSERVLVAQYMNGQDAGGGTGDPAMTLAVGTAQFREDYMFHAPANYEINYVNVVARAGANIVLDGELLTGFTPIGGSGYGLVRKQLAKRGTHVMTGDSPFGISVYGYGQYTSYWYPGGMNLGQIP